MGKECWIRGLHHLMNALIVLDYNKALEINQGREDRVEMAKDYSIIGLVFSNMKNRKRHGKMAMHINSPKF
jgi:hypothetical protein